MNAFKIETKIMPADQFLQDYQVNDSPLKTKSDGTIQSGKADDFEIICRDGSFGVHVYCLHNSDFLYKQYTARKNFDAEGKWSNKISL